MEFVRDLFNFLRQRKKYWLIPLIIILVLIGFIVVVTGGTAVAPFIYTLF
jgi:hypothetical protein